MDGTIFEQGNKEISKDDIITIASLYEKLVMVRVTIHIC